MELPIIRRFWLHCFARRPTFQAALIIPDLQAIVRAIETGGGISILPDYLCRESLEAGRTQILWEPPQRVTNELWLAYRKVDRNDAKMNQFRRILS